MKKLNYGTSSLDNRIKAINKMADAGYKVGILIAPVILLENWKEQYLELVKYLADNLNVNVKKQAFFEIIFMTYSYVHRMINADVFPRVAEEIYHSDMMKGRGNGKYAYKIHLKEEGETFLRDIMKIYFPHNEIKYIC